MDLAIPTTSTRRAPQLHPAHATHRTIAPPPAPHPHAHSVALCLVWQTVEILKKSMQSGKPHFGICMGNQLIGLAAGGSVGKMPFGNRGHNQPVLNQLNNKAHVTSQNHG